MAAALLLNKKDGLTNYEYIVQKSLIYFGMKKVKDDAIEKIFGDENMSAMKDFEAGGIGFIFIMMQSSDMITISAMAPDPKQIKRKALLLLKARQEEENENPDNFFPTGIANEVVFMEITGKILANLYSSCQEIFLPVLGNPLNQIGWSDLVSKDLMDNFHQFLAHTQVTLGLVEGRTSLPLPPPDVTQSEKTSSKDKAAVLESAIGHWTKQIKAELRKDPETALKKGNHPGPNTEIEFWKNKSTNLNSICEQLAGERIKKVLKFLEQNKSTQTSAFSKLQKEVQTARLEADENYKYLQTLEKYFYKLGDTSLDLTEVAELFVPIMHTILLIWTYSQHYNTPARLLVLIREICNAIITQCSQQVDSDKIFGSIKNEDPGEAHSKLMMCMDFCAKFKEAYYDHKAQSKNAWKITPSALFVRLDAFIERCQDIMQLTQTIQQFNKLKKIEIGNTKGKAMSAAIVTIEQEFTHAVEKFMMVDYDIMNIEKKQFADDFFKFRQRIKELERRLASILTQSFDDCDTLVGKFKLLESFEGLLTREIILDELEKKQITLLELYKQDLKIVGQIFQEGRILVDKMDENSPVSSNMPPISGAINWTTGLYERIKDPMERLQGLSQSLQDREEYKDVIKLFHSLRKNLDEFNATKIDQWERGVEENTEDQLNKYLLVREETDQAEEGLIRVNFNPILVRYLREVKYLQILDIAVPQRAAALFAKVETYRRQTGRLDLIVEMYNNIIATLLAVEKPLMMERIQKMNKALQSGIDTLKWNSENIDPFINQAMAIVTEVDELVKKMKDNVSKMIEIMNNWSKPLFDRRPRTMAPEDVETNHNASVNARFDTIKSEGKEIHKLMKDTVDNVRPDKKSPMWLSYVDYVNGLVIEGITNGIDSSMTNLAEQISISYNQIHQLAPIFDIKVALQNRVVQFDPSIGSNARQNGIRDIISMIVQHFISLAIQMPQRLDSPSGDYLVEIKDQFQLFGTIQLITSNLDEIENASAEFLHQYSDIQFLWEHDLETSFQAFLDKGPSLRETFLAKLKARDDLEDEMREFEIENFDAMSTKILHGIVTKQPALDVFDAEITRLYEYKARIMSMKPTADIGWLRVNSQPLIKELQQIINSWIERFTSFLYNNTTKQMKNIQEFVQEVKQGIKVLPKDLRNKTDKQLLTKVMTHLRDVTQIKEQTMERFPSLRDTIQLLKKHNVDVNVSKGVDLLVTIENSRTELEDTADNALGPIKEAILPLQSKESDNVKVRVREFQIKVLDFRLEFQKNLPYNTQEASPAVIDAAYNKISEYYLKTCQMEEEAKQLQVLEQLFELQRTKQKELMDCKNELFQLKQMWDLISIIDGQFEAWKETLWDNIDADNLEVLLKNMKTSQTAPNLAQNKEIKNYKAFQALNDRVKNMDVIRPLIQQLHSEFMQPRHWKKLNSICGRNVNRQDPKFCLRDIIDLELYKYAEDVNELVEGAQKEASIEKKLNIIINTWGEQTILTFKEYKDTRILDIGGLEEIVENVDLQSMDLMTMNASKDSEEFKPDLLKWQKTLKTIDQVLVLWVKVQKNWMRLEPIFLASEDIRAQLPEDTKRFEKVDAEWKGLMADANEDCGVVAATNTEGRDKILEEFISEIDLCEKALNEYLEQKKKIFPRFYFVSNQALLDILSNGNNPEKVNEYIGDCFDGMKCMKFLEEGNRPYRTAVGMISKDGEYVPFQSNFTCGGAVENYLCDLERKMQETLKVIIVNAKETTDDWVVDNPREMWLDGYCAQLALLATQIVYTEESIRTFDDLESGSESAMKEYLLVIKARIGKLISRVRGDLTMEIRIKVITIITIDVHSRDVTKMFVDRKIQEQSHFMWASQLKFGMEKKNPKDELKQCVSTICDWKTWYNYEFIGNVGRLVITPLTDRCYITLTQALNLSMGGAPAGPAGTGKTETTKDLGRALGLQVVVFNCSDQMNFNGMALIFMGLSQAGAWGCFDEFNRIKIEVLSVVSTQVKICLDATKRLKANPANFMFTFDEDSIVMKITSGYFITMNPGYAGRTELPENLKALFRSCAMVVPDIVLICENMLMAEGFEEAQDLSKKFMTLYSLAKSLLSQQIHYDWGLRAVKSVLRQAGGLKRQDPTGSEYEILMRALRDFNLPKIVVEDRKIFRDLINDLFPNMDPVRSQDQSLINSCQEVAIKAGRQPEDGFIQKCVELAEILFVRHSMFLIGNPGSGKTAIWKNMAEAFTNVGTETIYDIVDPKAVTSDELFGCMNVKTKEWKDGVLSVMMRDMNKCQGKFKATQQFKWVILDGDVDPMWIESLNTVMDDNKVLTLVSQERIPLTPSMRLLIEVSNLRNATPATVSRGGVLYVNDTDISCRPYIDTWLSKYKSGKKDDVAVTSFTLFLTQYCNDSYLEDLKHRHKIAPTCDMGGYQSMTIMIDYQYNQLYETKENQEYLKRLRETPEDFNEKLKMIYEGFFSFAFMWAFGGSIDEEKIPFSNNMRSMCKVKFPEGGLCFDYFFDAQTLQYEPWSKKVTPFNADFEGLFQNLVVPTAETTRQSYILDIHRSIDKGVLYIGTAGTGKTTILKDYFTTLDSEKVINATMNFNSYTDSKALQTILQGNVDKRSGKILGPAAGRHLIFFMDDLNMPKVDSYGTQSPLCLIRQIIDYEIIFDRDHLEEQYILKDIMFAACMNPKSGSFYVDLRTTRHFTQIALGVPEKEILLTIYQQMLVKHFQGFDQPCVNIAPKLVNATVAVFNGLAFSPQFAPTAIKFHYQFNMRDVAKIVQNLMLAQANSYKGNPTGLVRMWAHECHRVWQDRLLFDEDRAMYLNYMRNGLKELVDYKEEVVLAEPLIYTSFVAMCKGHEASYKPVDEIDDLKQVLEAKLLEYNETVSTMDLVLFQMAMEHITRIARIVQQPCGNALLVGVGGSGKQSLSKLTAFMLSLEVFRIVVSTNYGLGDLKTDIQTLFTKSGVQGIEMLFLMTDSQIVDNKFLVYINDILSAGYIPELFAPDEIDTILGKIRSEAKSQGVLDAPDTLLQFFINKVRKNLHMGLCFSPVGDAFRFRARQFPGLINCTSIDWFHAWPRDALVGVANKFLANIETLSVETRDQIANHMANVHLSIDSANQQFKERERRFNYTTPTSFLELISFYQSLLGRKQGAIIESISRLERGLNTMEETTNKVDMLKEKLVLTMENVKIEEKNTDELILIVNKEADDAEREQAIAQKQEEETNIIANEAKKQMDEATKQLEAAIPAMQAAEDAVDCLSVKAVVEFSSFTAPPSGSELATKAVQILKGGFSKKQLGDWPTMQKMMKPPPAFIQSLKEYNKDSISDAQKKELKTPELLLNPVFTYENMLKKSSAAANIANWVINVVKYNDIYVVVEPLKLSAEASSQLAAQKGEELRIVQERVAEIIAKVNLLKAQLAEAEAKKAAVVAQATNLQQSLDLANRLVNGLADENVRWKANVVTYQNEKLTMIGNALVSAAFVSYIGPFSFEFRNMLWRQTWIPDMQNLKIPFTDGIDPLTVLSTPSQQATWASEGLPADRVSIENAAVVVSCSRYPLLIDPQLQGIKWIRGKEGGEMITIQLTAAYWQKKVELAVSTGQTLMIDGIGQEIDAVLDPLLSRQFIKKGKTLLVKLGSEEVEVAKSFKLYIQTKLINPHYKPETAAQCTIVNFIVTEGGLEDQLLAMVVRVEKPELEARKEQLTNQQQEFIITLANLEADLLYKLVSADSETILQNVDLIVSLEQTKETSIKIQQQQIIARETEKEINISRESYRPVAAEGAMLYFLLIQLWIIDHMYQYSLESFQTFFFKAIEKTEETEDINHRVELLRLMIRITIYQWVSRGLFERHKQIFLSQLTFRLMQKKVLIVNYTPQQMNFLINCPLLTSVSNPLKKWLPDKAWYSVMKLVELEGFEAFATNLSKDAPARFQMWYNEIDPEERALPLEWRSLEAQPFQKLLVVRCMRPDRVTTALNNFIRATLPKGSEFVECDSSLSSIGVLELAYQDSSSITPIFFILSPGANPVKDVESLCIKEKMDPNKHLHTIALGQGQDVVAHAKLDMAHKEGHWVMLQNVHLMPDFLLELEKKLAAFALEGSDPSFRLYLTSDPSDTIPIGLLERSIKLTNEPPAGLKANLLRAFTFFIREEFEDKDPKVKTILFSLCYFHSMMLERRKFGSKGFNMMYPFSIGDLRDSAIVLQNYLDSNAGSGKIPWDDLRYIFGEIMYGGHIVDDLDRIFAKGFLQNLMNDTLLDEANMFPFAEGKAVFKCPAATTYEKYIEYIETELPPETPMAFGMHPNAEIDFRTTQCDALFKMLVELQPKDSGASKEGGDTVQSKTAEFMSRVADEAQLEQNKPNVEDILSKLSEEDRKPYQNVFIQECEVICLLIKEIIRSLAEVDLANKGELTMTEQMEKLMSEIFINRVPTTWLKLSFATTRSLASWLDNIKQRLEQLNSWKEDPTKEPYITFVNRLYNPQSFFTAVKQVTARRDNVELNKLYIQTEVQKRMYWETAELPKKQSGDGAYVFGFQVEGARWDASGGLEESEPKKQFSVVPVVNCKPVLVVEGKEEKGVYQCPIYMNESRGKTFVTFAQLKTKHPPLRWVLAGVALILDVEGVSDAFPFGKEPAA